MSVKASQAAVQAVQKALGQMNIVGPMRHIFRDDEMADALEVLLAQEIEAVAVAAADAAAPWIAAQALRALASELEDEIYPADIFIPPTGEGALRDHLLLKKVGSTVDKYSAAGARNVAAIARDRADRIEAGQEVPPEPVYDSWGNTVADPSGD